MRHYRIFLILVVSTVLVTGLFANDTRYGADTVLEVRKTKIAPVIDGVMDPIWRGVSETWMTSFTNGTSAPDDKADLYGSFKLMWDDNNIYGFFTSYDDALQHTNTDPNSTHENDGWEVYFDGNYSRGTSYDGTNDCQLRMKWETDIDATTINGTAPADLLTAVQQSAELAQVNFTNEDGWYLEFKIPLDVIQLPATAGTKFGFEAQQNDNDGEGRVHVSKWWLQEGDLSWNNASVFGTAVLLPEIVTSVRQQSVAGISDYHLSQNYPNPFNPATTISYTIAKAGMVRLSVYNLLGKEVATLVNGVKQAGEYKASFNAADLSSGVYFYKLQAGNTILTNKMVLLK